MSEIKTISVSEQLVLVTGAARGLGRAISEAFAREGATVVINYYRSKDAAEALAKEIGENAIAIQADVRDDTATKKLVAQGPAHINTPITTINNNALPEVE